MGTKIEEVKLEVDQKLVEEGWRPIWKPTSIVYLKAPSTEGFNFVREAAKFHAEREAQKKKT